MCTNEDLELGVRVDQERLNFRKSNQTFENKIKDIRVVVYTTTMKLEYFYM